MKGGTLFKLTPELANLKSQGDNNSCAACVLSTLDFPSRTIQQCIMHAAYEEGISDKDMLAYVQQLENSVKTQILHKIPLEDSKKSEFVYYGVSKDKSTQIIGEKNFSHKLKKIGTFRNISYNTIDYNNKISKALEYIFNIITPGYANILNILWSYRNERNKLCTSGHWVVIGKELDNTIYLIDSQDGPLKGLHKGLFDILGYLYFLTSGQTGEIEQTIDYLGTIIGGKMIDIDTKEQRHDEREQTRSRSRSRSPSRSPSRDAGKITNKYRKKAKQNATRYRKKHKKDKKPRTHRNKKGKK